MNKEVEKFLRDKEKTQRDGVAQKTDFVPQTKDELYTLIDYETGRYNNGNFKDATNRIESETGSRRPPQNYSELFGDFGKENDPDFEM